MCGEALPNILAVRIVIRCLLWRSVFGYHKQTGVEYVSDKQQVGMLSTILRHDVEAKT